ncbi:MAG: hypothetical protein ACREHG_00740, partial [Candidatus Saccharimonadales bacterium]
MKKLPAYQQEKKDYVPRLKPEGNHEKIQDSHQERGNNQRLRDVGNQELLFCVIGIHKRNLKYARLRQIGQLIE